MEIREFMEKLGRQFNTPRYCAANPTGKVLKCMDCLMDTRDEYYWPEEGTRPAGVLVCWLGVELGTTDERAEDVIAPDTQELNDMDYAESLEDDAYERWQDEQDMAQGVYRRD